MTILTFYVGQIQKKKIAELKARVKFLLELHEKNDEEFTKVSVDFQKICMLITQC